MRKLLILIMLPAVLLLACNEDNDPDVQLYSAKVTNTTGATVTIYFQTGSGSFTNRGNIASGEFRVYDDLILETNYTMRASWEGQSAEEYFSQQFITNDNPDIISLNFDILE